MAASALCSPSIPPLLSLSFLSLGFLFFSRPKSQPRITPPSSQLNANSKMSAVGFDVGNDSCVIGTVRQLGIDVLLNVESDRDSPAVVCFGDKQRFIGAATASQVKRLIVRPFRDPVVQDDHGCLPFYASEAPDGGILLRVRFLNEQRAITPVQILAYLKQIAE